MRSLISRTPSIQEVLEPTSLGAQQYTRVTESLDYFTPQPLVDWKLRVGKAEANRISKKALKIGKRVHELITGADTPSKKDSQEVKNCHTAYLKWVERYQVRDIIIPPRLYDEKLLLTGEPDYYWMANKTLIDLKCSARISPHYFFQLGGYHRFKVYDVEQLGILRLDKETGDFEYLTNEQLGLTLTDCIDAFESAFKHYRYYTHLDKQIGERNG